MEMILNREFAGLGSMQESDVPGISAVWPTGELTRAARSLDCVAMAQMSLPALLYYILAGDGRG